ncbi:hypothetical protein VNO78_20920 [Psophocarpus tetragonolobus]|uniref:Uncharacterized protein n=1 Tax=Psophocarpus tetragonolobus TaxID=3891 RepID=A0AAN9XHN7_PSOTE
MPNRFKFNDFLVQLIFYIQHERLMYFIETQDARGEHGFVTCTQHCPSQLPTLNYIMNLTRYCGQRQASKRGKERNLLPRRKHGQVLNKGMRKWGS